MKKIMNYKTMNDYEKLWNYESKILLYIGNLLGLHFQLLKVTLTYVQSLIVDLALKA